MYDLATLTAQPRRHRLTTGRVIRLHPLRIRDLGRLQAWLDRQSPDPLDAMAPTAGVMGGGPARWLLTRGVAKVERDRPQFGSEEADRLIGSVGGLTEVLYLSMRRGDRRGIRFTRRHAAEAYWQLGDSGPAKLHWAINGPLPIGGTSSDADPIDWWGMIGSLAAGGDFKARDFQSILDLTLPQLRCVASAGKRTERKVESVEEYDAIMKAIEEDPWYIG